MSDSTVYPVVFFLLIMHALLHEVAVFGVTKRDWGVGERGSHALEKCGCRVVHGCEHSACAKVFLGGVDLC